MNWPVPNWDLVFYVSGAAGVLFGLFAPSDLLATLTYRQGNPMPVPVVRTLSVASGLAMLFFTHFYR